MKRVSTVVQPSFGRSGLKSGPEVVHALVFCSTEELSEILNKNPVLKSTACSQALAKELNLPDGDISLVTTETDRWGPFSSLEDLFGDTKWVSEQAAFHSQLANHLHSLAPSLPFPFGTVYPNAESVVAELIQGSKTKIRPILSLKDQAEILLQARLDLRPLIKNGSRSTRDDDSEQSRREDTEIKSKFDQEQQISKLMNALKESTQQSLLKEEVEHVFTETPIPGGNHSPLAQPLVSLSVLLPRTEWREPLSKIINLLDEAIGASVLEKHETLRQNGHSVTCSLLPEFSCLGPLAPFSFFPDTKNSSFAHESAAFRQIDNESQTSKP